MFTTDKLRESFLQFFASKGHKVVPSDSLVPADDPTVLFTSAGMNQFKPQFMGHITDFTRATSCQKCLRTDDLPQVGKTPYHHTFFEMLGNFSFGDYFKEEAITWAWEYLTEVLGIDPERLWVSVHKDDEEAYTIWKDKIGIPEHKIARLGDKTNFWPSNAIVEGPNGPCGPCSEIFFDQGREFSAYAGDHKCGPDCDCGRFAEIWNLVFTQFDRRDGGILEPLPQKNIDTGMGLERISAVMQGKKSNFEIDIFVPIVEEILRLAGRSRKDVDISKVYSIADHIRAVTFAIGDGVIPSNEGRGYVIRKLIRKSVWHLQELGGKRGLARLVPVIAEVMKRPYPELKERQDVVAGMISAEEERFLRTLEVGLNKISEEIERHKREGKNRLSGEVCFLLYDTYGFPLEMSKAIAEQEGLEVDEEGFKARMEEQRKRSQASTKTLDDIFAYRNLREVGRGMCFVGYDRLAVETTIRAILRNDDILESAEAEQEVDIVLEDCPFYGEAGGQIGDTGWISSEGGRAVVLDTYRVGDVVVCKARIEEGSLRSGEKVKAEVDIERRKAIARHHTATHLLQSALRRVLGDHIRQAGSMVAPDRLRFDFTHFQAITDEELREIEDLVNHWIMENYRVEKIETTLEKAKEMGALAFFGEKYGEVVRVIKIDEISCELCGGTHVDWTGQLGVFTILSERSVSSGVRRIEAISGVPAWDFLRGNKAIVDELKDVLKCEVSSLVPTVKDLAGKVRKLEKELERLSAKERAEELLNRLKEEELKGIRIFYGLLDGADLPALRSLWDQVKAKDPSAVGILAGVSNGKAQMLLACGRDLAKRLDMRKVLEDLKEVIPLSGGGRPDFVQVGIKTSGEDLKKKWEELKDRAVSGITRLQTSARG